MSVSIRRPFWLAAGLLLFFPTAIFASLWLVIDALYALLNFGAAPDASAAGHVLAYFWILPAGTAFCCVVCFVMYALCYRQE